MLAQLIPEDGGEPLTLHEDVTLVGRKRGLCDFVIDRSSISKIHCILVKTDGLLFIRDLGSTNGTKVNGQRVTRGALLPGDELAFASVRFRVHLGPDVPGTGAVGGHEPTEMLDVLDDSDEFAPLELVDDDDIDHVNPLDDRGSSQSDVRMLSDSEYE